MILSPVVEAAGDDSKTTPGRGQASGGVLRFDLRLKSILETRQSDGLPEQILARG